MSKGKMLVLISIAMAFLAGFQACKKNNKGKVTAEIRYRNPDIPEGPSGTSDTLKHQGLGNFITSITPDSFRAKFYTVRFQEDWTEPSLLMELIENNIDYQSPKRLADFTSGNEVVLEPVVYYANQGKVITSKKVLLKYFYWDLAWFHQVFTLPSAYGSVGLMGLAQDEFSYNNQEPKRSARNNLDLKVRCDHYPLMGKMFGNPPGEIPRLYVFGNTDSSFVFNTEYKQIGLSRDNPMGGTANHPVVRSNQYQEFTFNYSETEDLRIRATVTFDFKDLIQLYAGKDNIPYTVDDVVIYAPRYWERLKVKVTQTQ